MITTMLSWKTSLPCSKVNFFICKNSILWSTSNEVPLFIWMITTTSASRQNLRACRLFITDNMPFSLLDPFLLSNIVQLFGVTSSAARLQFGIFVGKRMEKAASTLDCSSRGQSRQSTIECVFPEVIVPGAKRERCPDLDWVSGTVDKRCVGIWTAVAVLTGYSSRLSASW